MHFVQEIIIRILCYVLSWSLLTGTQQTFTGRKLVLWVEVGSEKLFMNITNMAKTLVSGNKIELLSSSIFSFPYNYLQNNPNFTFHSHYYLKNLQASIKSVSVRVKRDISENTATHHKGK